MVFDLISTVICELQGFMAHMRSYRGYWQSCLFRAHSGDRRAIFKQDYWYNFRPTSNKFTLPCYSENENESIDSFIWGTVRKNIISDRFSTKTAISAHI